MNDQQNFFKLLKYSNELRKNDKYLDNEDPASYKILLHFGARIEDNLHYSQKQKYIELIQDFLADQITAEDFSDYFIAIYDGINKKKAQMEIKESLELANFLEPNRSELGELFGRTYNSCCSYSPDPEVECATCDEKELRDDAQILLFKLQEE